MKKIIEIAIIFQGSGPWDIKLEEEMKNTESLETVAFIIIILFPICICIFSGFYVPSQWAWWAAQNKDGIIWSKDEAYHHPRRPVQEGEEHILLIDSHFIKHFISNPGKLENPGRQAGLRDLFYVTKTSLHNFPIREWRKGQVLEF